MKINIVEVELKGIIGWPLASGNNGMGIPYLIT